MSNKRRVVFFGASVTEQDVHHATGELTGYVTYFKKHLAEDWDVQRVSAGSSSIADAAIVYAEQVVALKPEICVIDWVTPALTDCDPRLVRQLYYRLMQNGILPVTVFFPRRDRIQSTIQIAREMAAICAEFDLPLFDAQSLVDKHGIDTILRDTVHTTKDGARIYAETMADLLAKVQSGRSFPAGLQPPFTVTALKTDAALPGHFIRMVVYNAGPKDEELEFTLIMEQRVGPFSPVLNIKADHAAGTTQLPSFTIWDAWSYRERQCIKPIMGWYRGPLTRLEITISPTDPPYAQIPKASPVPLAGRHLKQRGDLFLVTRSDAQCKMTYRCDNMSFARPAAAPADPKPAAPAPVAAATPVAAPAPVAAPVVAAAPAAAPVAAPAPVTAPVAPQAAGKKSDPRMDCILHIGIGTAGSATIQSALEAARRPLYEAGILYPEDLLSNGTTGGDNQKCLAVASMEATDNIVLRQHQALTPPQRTLFNRRVFDHYKATVAAAGDRVCLLSAEHFWSCLTRSSEIAHLAGQMEAIGLRVRKIIVYLRRQSDWFESLQQQRLREARELLPLEAAALVNPNMQAVLDYAATLQKWQAGFPEAELCPRIFDHSAFVDGDLLKDFVAATGLAMDLPTPESRTAGSMSNAGINALLYINGKFPVIHPNGEWNQARGDIVPFLSSHMPGDCVILPQDERQKIDAMFAEPNENVRARYFPDRPSLFSQDYKADRSEQFTLLDDPDLFRAMDAFLLSWRLARGDVPQ